MTDQPTPAEDGVVADWLLGWEDAAAAGAAPPDPNGVDIPPEIQARLARGVECLGALRGTRLGRTRSASAPTELASRFTVLRELGRGGFGVVYHAVDQVLRREVAVKVPYAEQLGHPAGWRRFALEAELAARLDHPNVVAVFDAGADADTPYLAVEYCPGWPLSEWLRMTDGPVPWREAAGLVRAVAAGVHHAHTRGVLHRDLKPANILLAAPDPADPRVRPLGWYTPKVADFGLAKPVSGTDERLTLSGVLPGTPAYLAPELFDGRQATPTTAADVYALGVILYELLAGRPPFAADTPLATLDLARTTDPPPLRPTRRDLPADLETVCLKCLRKNPAERYASAGELADDLDRAARDEPIRARPLTAAERIRRGVRRHPVATLAVLFGLVTLAALGAAVVQAGRAAEQSARVEAVDAERLAVQHLDDQTAVRIDAGSMQSTTARRQAIELVEKWRVAYSLDTGNWRERPLFARLLPAQQQAVTASLGEQALLAAHAERLNATGLPAAEEAAALERAVVWNRRAEAVFAPDVPAAVGEQRAALARLIGRGLPELPPPPADGPIDLYLRALGQVADGDHRGAAVTLEELERQQPQHAAGQFALGFVYQSAGRLREATERYLVAKAMAPRDYRAPFNRGILQLYNRHPDEAVSDLTTAIDRNPKVADAYYLRATARYQLAQRLQGPTNQPMREEKLALALADLHQAAALGGERYRHVAMRARVRADQGDAAGAEADKRALEEMTPTEDQDYISRGNRRYAEKRYADALADFTRATELNPRYYIAWTNLAATQAVLGRHREAIESYGQAIRLMPDNTTAKFKLAVLYARLGDRDTAFAQIRGLSPPNADSWFQQAAVYALCSAINLNDRAEAYRSLLAAARGGWTDWDAYDKDDDFELVRDLPDFARLRARKGRPAE